MIRHRNANLTIPLEEENVPCEYTHERKKRKQRGKKNNNKTKSKKNIVDTKVIYFNEEKKRRKKNRKKLQTNENKKIGKEVAEFELVPFEFSYKKKKEKK